MKPRLWNTVPVKEKAVAFTFDDGPNAVYTAELLDIFREAGGRATFFMVGTSLEEGAETAEAVHAAGHEIGNHTYTHPDMTKLTLEEAREELRRMEMSIRKVTGQPVRTFRPPYLAVDERILSLAAEEFQYDSIGAANPEARDWEQPGVGFILEKTRPTIREGAILLFHDGYGDRSQTMEAVRALVRELSEAGYRLVTVSELMAMARGETESFGRGSLS
ncbi:polysaccharide deacetylase family protein [Cohnella sp. AR92]|uniref:polysaccharide deacetylase family protein n=1 Tax=Cohnella sp. AR92 TaxID=648716 RepID=UPI000F8DCA9F|nr:polysaccharide deacetylase family protein [Cohnella sp. AR92]RUS45133.1 polysaccharide deacetylase family protein [Cohnella sp. AR92]